MFYLTTLSTFYLQLYGVRHMVTFSSRNELNVLFNNTLHTFYLRLYGVRHMVTFSSRKEMFYLTTHSVHFIYGYMASDIW